MHNTPIPDTLERTAAQWGAEAGTWAVGCGRNWLEVPAVRDRINRMISGQPDTDAYRWLVEQMAKRGRQIPFGRVLTLGCGAGDLERGLFGIGFAEHYEGIDVATQAIDRARSAAAALPGADIVYHVADINTIALDAERYDVIFCQMSAHHFSNLERVFSEVRHALKPGGVFFLNEYIGPKFFQWSPQQVTLIDTLLRNLPERWVRMADGGLRRGFTPSTIEEVVAVDPTEAIRSDEILPILAQQFTVTACIGYGGSLLHGLLDHIGINFVDDGPEAKAMLNTFFALEDWALAHEVLEHHFAVMVAERPQDLGDLPGIPAGLELKSCKDVSVAYRLSQQLNQALHDRQKVEDAYHGLEARYCMLERDYQMLEASFHRLEADNQTQQVAFAALETAYRALEQAYIATLDSVSWRCTAPMRWFKRVLSND